jgi:hypothetical protein
MDDNLSLYVWHRGKARYDEVLHLPGLINEDDARALALLKLQVDTRATRVHVEIGETLVDDIERIPPFLSFTRRAIHCDTVHPFANHAMVV